MSEKLPDGWKRVKLGEAMVFQRGYDLSRTKMQGGKFPVAASNGIIGFHNTYTTKAPGVTIGRSGNIGTPQFYNVDFWAHNTVLFVKEFKLIEPKYAYYFLKTIDFTQFNAGSSVPTLNRNHIHGLDILLPPLHEQKAIAGILSSLDDKIDLLHRQNKTLEEMAQTIFRKWFIEPCKDEIPSDWEEKYLKDIYIFEKGFEPGSKNYLGEEEPNTIRFIRVGDLLDDKGDTFIKKDLAKVICDEKDLLMSFDGTIGRVNFGLKGTFSSGIRKIYSKNPIYDNLGFKYLIFTSKDIQELINSHSSGSVILHASSSINYLSFPLPNNENYIKEFNKIIDPIFDKILQNKKQIHTLEQLRDTLLPKLMSGEVRVKL